MNNRSSSKVVVFTLIAAFSIAFVDSAARDEDAPGETDRTATIDGVDSNFWEPMLEYWND